MTDDLLSSLQELDQTPQESAGEPEDGWYTSSQIQEKLGWGENKARRMIRRGLDAGIYEMKKFAVVNAMGNLYHQPRYRLVQEEEAAE